MEKIIIRGKQYEKDSELYSYKKRMIFYDDLGQILVYQKDYGLYLPSVHITEETPFEEKLKNIFKIEFDEQNIEQLIQIISYDSRFVTHNNKLVKKYLKYVRDYYACLTNLDNQKDIPPIYKSDGKILEPRIMKLEDVIQYFKDLNLKYPCDKVDALEVLKQKVKEKEYERGNKIF